MQLETKDYYSILEVDKKSTEEEIKKSYKRLALKYHPDKNNGDETASDKFKEIAEAYSVLGNKERKREYDMMGMVSDNFGEDDPFSVFNSIFKDHINSFMNMKYENEINIDSLFGGMGMGNINIKVHTFPVERYENIEEEEFPQVGNIFENLFKNNLKTKSLNIEKKPKKIKILQHKPEDIIYKISVTLEDIYNKINKTITISRIRKKNGKYINKNKKVEIPIFGKEILLENEGNEFKDFKEKGNIIINIFNEIHKDFKRINDYDVLTYKDIDINHVYTSFIFDLILPNKELIKIQSEAMINNSSCFIQKVSKKGLPYKNEEGDDMYGNLYIIYKLILPKTIDELKNIEEIIDKSNIDEDYMIAYNCNYDEIFKNE
jgi:DnaJ-class molecular chaperone